jgi:hypothetical protein
MSEFHTRHDVRADVAPACHTRTHPSIAHQSFGWTNRRQTDSPPTTRRARDVETHRVRAHEI